MKCFFLSNGPSPHDPRVLGVHTCTSGVLGLVAFIFFRTAGFNSPWSRLHGMCWPCKLYAATGVLGLGEDRPLRVPPNTRDIALRVCEITTVRQKKTSMLYQQSGPAPLSMLWRYGLLVTNTRLAENADTYCLGGLG